MLRNPTSASRTVIGKEHSQLVQCCITFAITVGSDSDGAGHGHADHTLLHLVRWLPLLQDADTDFALLVDVGVINPRIKLDLIEHSIHNVSIE